MPILPRLRSFALLLSMAFLLGSVVWDVSAQSAVDPTAISVASTSDAGTSGNDVAIGETVRFRMVSRIPESTSITYTIRNQLAPNLEYVAGSANVSYQANTLPSFDGDFTGILNESTPSLSFPASRVSYDTNTNLLEFNFDSIINTDGDADYEFVHHSGRCSECAALRGGARKCA